MSLYKCCPICGNIFHTDNYYCEYCNIRHNEPMYSRYETRYYAEEAKRIFKPGEEGPWGGYGAWRAEEILLHEISQNPAFDQEKCKARIQRKIDRHNKEKRNSQKTLNIPTKNIPKCPICGSTNLKKLSAIKRGLHAYAFGIFSKTAFSQFECMSCHYKF